MDSKLTLGEAQRLVDEWIQNYGVRYFAPLTNMAILTEEVGEVARLMSRLYGEQSFKKSDEGHNLGDELADVLWVVLCIANQTGIGPRGSSQGKYREEDPAGQRAPPRQSQARSRHPPRDSTIIPTY